MSSDNDSDSHTHTHAYKPSYRIHARLEKLYYISDTHLEHNERGEREVPLATPENPATSAIALLGDIGWIQEDSYWKLISRCAALYANVFVILGNHEYFYHCIQELPSEVRNEFRKRCIPNTYFLENETVEFDNVVLWGSTLWTRPDWAAFQRINDSRLITDKSVPPPHRLSISTVHAIHHRATQYLRKELTLLSASASKPLILLTHHAPLIDANGEKYQQSVRTTAYVNRLDEFMCPPIVAWLYGHTHQNMTFHVNNIYVSTNAFGYPGEYMDVLFDPQKCFTVS